MARLSITDLTVTLGDPPRQVLSVPSARFDPGSITLVLGANGSGKSVFLRALLGLLAYSGSIRWDDREIRRYKSHVYPGVGVCFQNPDLQIFGETVAEEIEIVFDQRGSTGAPGRSGPSRSPSRSPSGSNSRSVSTELSEFGLAELAGKSPWELSGGQRRRLAIAGALAGAPEVVILDEPLIELDYPSIARFVRSLLSARDRGAVILVASHETRDLWGITDQVLVMHQGRPVYTGAPGGADDWVTPAYGLRPRREESDNPDEP